jgi:hypothetical protein
MNCATSMLSTVISGSFPGVMIRFCCLAPSRLTCFLKFDALELYEEIVAKGLATPRQIDAALDRHADAFAKGEAQKLTHYEWLKTTFVDPTGGEQSKGSVGGSARSPSSRPRRR